MASKNKKKKAKNKNQNNLQTESKKLDTLQPKQDHTIKTEIDKLFQRVKAKVEALKAATSTKAGSSPFHDISASTPEKTYPLEKKFENEGRDDLRDLPNVSERAEVRADTGPLLGSNTVQKSVNIKVPQPLSNSGSNPKIFKCENDNSAVLKPKKKKMKKRTTNIEIQTLLKQSNDTSPIVGLGPSSSDPVKESLVQELPECEVPPPVSNSGSNPRISSCENDNSTALKPRKETMKKKKKKTTNIKIQTLLEQSANTSPIVGCDTASFNPAKESLDQELRECEAPQPVSNSGSNPKILSCENDNSTLLKPKKKKMKKTKKKNSTDIKVQTLLEQSANTSLIVGCGPASIHPFKESLLQDLPECEVHQPVSNPGSSPKIFTRENDISTALNPKKKTTDVKIQTHLEQSANTSSVVGFAPTSFDPVVQSVDQKLPECEVPQPILNSGSKPTILKCENDNSTVLKPNQKTTDIKIQTHVEQSANTSLIVGFGPASFDPVKESLVQELPEGKVPQPVSNSGSDPIILNCENDNSTVWKPNQKTTDIKIQTHSEQSATTSLVGACGPASSNPVKETLVQELPECEVPQPMSNSGSNPMNLNCENDNSTVSKPKKKTTDVKIQTHLENSAKTSPAVGCGPASFDPVKESLVQELPECENINLESLPKNQDPISKDWMQSILEDVKVNIVARKAAENMDAPNIPFYDMSASTPDKAYPLEKIIEKEEWDCLGDLLNIPQGARLIPEAYPIFVCNRLQKLEKMKDEYKKRTVASVLQYITHLIKYKDKHSPSCHDKFVKDHKFPSILEEKFRAMFNESSSKLLPPAKRDLLINYVLVLSLFVDGYQSNAKDITKDLKINADTAVKHFKQLGCKPHSTKAGLLVELPVPLKFPVPKTRKKSRTPN